MIILSSRKNQVSEIEAIKKYQTNFQLDNFLLVYNLSPKHIPKIIFQKLIGKTILWYQHEVTDYKQKRENNGVFYSLVTRILELFFLVLSSRRCTGNPNIAKAAGIYFCPLLKNVDEQSFTAQGRDIDVLYIGRLDWRRSPEVIEELRRIAPEFHVLDLSKNKTFIADKEFHQLFRRAKFVLNRYTKPISQSGVTPEALANGAITIVSEYDLLASNNEAAGNLLVIPSSCSVEDATLRIVSAVTDYETVYQSVSSHAVNRFHGEHAFRSYWLDFIFGKRE